MTVLLALTTLWSAVVAGLQQNASGWEAAANRKYEKESVTAFGEASRAEQQVRFNLALYREWYTAGGRAEDARAAANAARLEGNLETASGLERRSQRWSQAQTDLESLTPFLVGEEYEGELALYEESVSAPAYLAAERQRAAAREAGEWGDKANAYLTILTSLAAALLLMGLSLTVRSRVRLGFVGVGVMIVFASVIWAAVVLVTPIHVTPLEAMEHFASGLAARRVADSRTPEQAVSKRDEAIAGFTEAVNLDRRYADAYQERAYARLQSRIAGADPEQASLAAADLTTAVRLGRDNPVVHANLGWALILKGDYAASEAASRRAVEMNEGECVAWLNLGLALLAQSQTEETGPAYDQAANCMSTLLPARRGSLYQATITDLKDLQTRQPETPGLPETLRRFQQEAASLELFGELQPRPTGALLTDLYVAASVGADDVPLDVSKPFAPGSSQVYIILEYEAVPEDTAWLVYLYRDGALYNTFLSQTWDHGDSGQTWVRFSDSPFPPGSYTAEVYLNGNYLEAVEFEMQPGESPDTSEYISPQFHLLLNYPSDWAVTEEEGEDGYLIGLHPTDDLTYFYYFTSAMEGNSDDLIAALHESWAEDYPDLALEDSDSFYLGGLPDGRWERVVFTDKGTPVTAYLTGAVDEAGLAHVLTYQSPTSAAVQMFDEVFSPLTRSLRITP